MDRRTVLKGGLVIAATAHTAAVSPEAVTEPPLEDPRITIQRLSWQIAGLLDQVPDYDLISIQASSRQKHPVQTFFTI